MEDQENLVPREAPEVNEARKSLVSKMLAEVKADKKHWTPAFDAMRDDQNFVRGLQWSDDEEDPRYVANITLRHVQQRVAALYAKNPSTVARMKDRIMSPVWDGEMGSVMSALEKFTAAATAMQSGMGSPEMLSDMQEAVQISEEARRVTEEKEQLRRFGQTLQLTYDHNLQEQPHPFKTMMKLVVRRGLINAVSYVKLGFQRAMELSPSQEAQLRDESEKLATLERIAADVADGQITDENDAEMERLRLLIEDIQNTPQVLVREGISLDYPDSTAVIPDRNCRVLRGFMGCDRVSQEYVMPVHRVQEIYGVDLKTSGGFTEYRLGEDGVPTPSSENTYGSHGDGEKAPETYALVWEIYNKPDGMVYVVCDGYEDFLREPAQPPVYTERFWPWFQLIFNECDHPKEVYPPSDVRLIRSMQQEYNRLREGLREHRKMNRPGTVSASGTLDAKDKEVLQARPAAAHVELSALQPGQKISDVLQALPLPGVDPNLYEVNPIFEDILRTVGTQEANLGGVSGGTATETSVAESSRLSTLQASIDELDDLLSELARASGQILLAELSVETVRQIVGPGAVWPEMSREQLANEVYLEIEAGSTGRPNQAQEIQNLERLAPIIMQIPGIVPEKFAKEVIRRLDDKLDLSELYNPALPSISALNQIAGSAPGGMQQNASATGKAPAEQGPQGAQNQQAPGRTAGSPGGPDIPAPEGPPN